MISSLEGQRVVGATSRMFTPVGTGEEETRYSIVAFESGAFLYMEGVDSGDKWKFFQSEEEFLMFISQLPMLRARTIQDWWMVNVHVKIKYKPLEMEGLDDVASKTRRAS